MTAIIGLLASMVIVNLNRARVKARDTRRKADLRQITTALVLNCTMMIMENVLKLAVAVMAQTVMYTVQQAVVGFPLWSLVI